MRRRAGVKDKGPNEVAIETLAEGIGRCQRRDLSDIVGTWKKDAAVAVALAAQDEVDEHLCK